MPEYGSWDALVAAAQFQVRDILFDDVGPVAKEIVQKHIRSDIYGAYSPKTGAWVNGTTYPRRNFLENSVYREFIDDETLLITSDASASKSIVKGYSFSKGEKGAFLKLIEQGPWGIWKHGFPRPAIANAQREIDSSAAIRSAIEHGIKSRIG